MNITIDDCIAVSKHTNKPFACVWCHWAFKDKNELVKHLEATRCGSSIDWQKIYRAGL